MEGFLTIHQLSTQFNISSRSLRDRINKLVLTGKLIEHRDFVRLNYIDANHFEWRVNPIAFMNASGLALSPVRPKMAPKPENATEAKPPAQGVHEAAADGARPVNQTPPSVNPPVHAPTATVHQGEPPATKIVHAVHEEVNEAAPRGFLREMVDFFKDQIGIKDRQLDEKDRQISALTEQNKAAMEMNTKLTGQVVQQAARIEELLSLPAAGQMSARTINVDEPRDATVHQDAAPESTEGAPAAADTVNDAHPRNTDAGATVHAVHNPVNEPVHQGEEAEAV